MWLRLCIVLTWLFGTYLMGWEFFIGSALCWLYMFSLYSNNRELPLEVFGLCRIPNQDNSQPLLLGMFTTRAYALTHAVEDVHNHPELKLTAEDYLIVLVQVIK